MRLFCEHITKLRTVCTQTTPKSTGAQFSIPMGTASINSTGNIAFNVTFNPNRHNKPPLCFLAARISIRALKLSMYKPETRWLFKKCSWRNVQNILYC